jgi:hypothetical protein
MATTGLSHLKSTITAKLPSSPSKSQKRAFYDACYKGDAAKAQTLIAGIDLSARDESGYAPIHLATAGGHTEVVKLLIAKGASVFARTLYGKTAVDLAKGSGNAACTQLVSENVSSLGLVKLAAEKSEIIQKSVAAFCGIGNANGVDYEGFDEFFTHQIIANFFKNLTPAECLGFISSEDRTVLSKAFERAAALRFQSLAKDKSPLAACQKLELIPLIHAGAAVIIPAGFNGFSNESGHAIDVVFFGKYMAVCNRGDRDIAPIMLYEINPKKVTAETLVKILNLNEGISKGSSAEIAQKMEAAAYVKLYEEIPNSLAVKDKQSTSLVDIHKLFTAIAQPHQRVGNCTATSAKAALLFIWTMLYYNPKGSAIGHLNAAERTKEGLLRLREKAVAEMPPKLDPHLEMAARKKNEALAQKLSTKEVTPRASVKKVKTESSHKPDVANKKDAKDSKTAPEALTKKAPAAASSKTPSPTASPGKIASSK